MINKAWLDSVERLLPDCHLPWRLNSWAMGCGVTDAAGDFVTNDSTLKDAERIVALGNAAGTLMLVVRELQDALARFANDSDAYRAGEEAGARRQRNADIQIARNSMPLDGSGYILRCRLESLPLVTDGRDKK